MGRELRVDHVVVAGAGRAGGVVSALAAVRRDPARCPSAFGITAGCPASVTAITEFVVPRSMPTAVATAASLS
jgi:hypothetical protein